MYCLTIHYSRRHIVKYSPFYPSKSYSPSSLARHLVSHLHPRLVRERQPGSGLDSESLLTRAADRDPSGSLDESRARRIPKYGCVQLYSSSIRLPGERLGHVVGKKIEERVIG
jgi:hypothetical protein